MFRNVYANVITPRMQRLLRARGARSRRGIETASENVIVTTTVSETATITANVTVTVIASGTERGSTREIATNENITTGDVTRSTMAVVANAIILGATETEIATGSAIGITGGTERKIVIGSAIAMGTNLVMAVTMTAREEGIAGREIKIRRTRRRGARRRERPRRLGQKIHVLLPLHMKESASGSRDVAKEIAASTLTGRRRYVSLSSALKRT